MKVQGGSDEASDVKVMEISQPLELNAIAISEIYLYEDCVYLNAGNDKEIYSPVTIQAYVFSGSGSPRYVRFVVPATGKNTLHGRKCEYADASSADAFASIKTQSGLSGAGSRKTMSLFGTPAVYAGSPDEKYIYTVSGSPACYAAMHGSSESLLTSYYDMTVRVDNTSALSSDLRQRYYTFEVNSHRYSTTITDYHFDGENGGSLDDIEYIRVKDTSTGTEYRLKPFDKEGYSDPYNVYGYRVYGKKAFRSDVNWNGSSWVNSEVWPAGSMANNRNYEWIAFKFSSSAPVESSAKNREWAVNLVQ